MKNGIFNIENLTLDEPATGQALPSGAHCRRRRRAPARPGASAARTRLRSRRGSPRSTSGEEGSAEAAAFFRLTGGVRVGAVEAQEVTPGVRDLHEDPGHGPVRDGGGKRQWRCEARRCRNSIASILSLSVGSMSSCPTLGT
jgi:hypothetical protein